jgi:hypothetical protein
MPKIQTAANHTALDTVTHFILLPIFFINFIVAIVLAFHAQGDLWIHLWLVVVSFGLLVSVPKMRIYSLRVQDRVIRLEERLRILALAPEIDVDKLSTAQLIALRFASDAELPALAARTVVEGLEPKAIKGSIVTWRPDYNRI